MHTFYKNKNTNSIAYNGGQVMLLLVMFFLTVSLTIVMGVAQPILKQVKGAQELVKSKQTYFVASGVLEDALYRTQANGTLTNGETFVVNGATTTISVTTTQNGKVIEATTNYNGLYRKMSAQMKTGQGASFNYGIQAGAGGVNISGNSTINGNVYSNGPIIGNGGSDITGTAVSANGPSLTSNQANTTPTPITTCSSSTCITFRNTATTQDVAQKFVVSADAPIRNIKFYVKKNGNPADITVRIVADNNGVPGTTVVTSGGTLLSSLVSSSNFGWVDVIFSDNPTLYAGNTYWIVLDNGTQNVNNYYFIGANTNYAAGLAKVGQQGGTWNDTSPSGLDIYFELFTGGINGSIGGGTYPTALMVGFIGVGDAWANTVSGTTVAGNLYCQTGTQNNKSCNTSRANPAAIGYPLSDANIQDWKDEAAVTGGWTYNGNLTIGYQGTTTSTLKHVNGNLTINGGGTAVFDGLEVNGDVQITGGGHLIAGPIKVNGNLNINSQVVIKGTVWVTGNISVSSGADVELHSSYGANSGVFVADGYITLNGGSEIEGSGQAGSYTMLVSTSNCPIAPSCAGNSAITISGGAGAVVLVAQNGRMTMSGGTSVKALTADEIYISGGSTVIYDSGIADLNFTSGPSGGWEISNWKEVQ
jgi:cytoskeletal protein CcmA (bactofilin family)